MFNNLFEISMTRYFLTTVSVLIINTNFCFEKKCPILVKIIIVIKNLYKPNRLANVHTYRSYE